MVQVQSNLDTFRPMLCHITYQNCEYPGCVAVWVAGCKLGFQIPAQFTKGTIQTALVSAQCCCKCAIKYKPVGWSNWGGSGASIWFLSWILAPSPGMGIPTWAAWSCTRNFAGIALSCPIVSARILLKVRGIHSPYSWVAPPVAPNRIGYGVGRLTSLFQHMVRMGCRWSWASYYLVRELTS